ncbi:MAG: nuclear transport factor 2 family protein [Gemmatimonadales bacterium]|nr:nuclear transport factor 2 family protein [Gemmatimonadales bacterium]
MSTASEDWKTLRAEYSALMQQFGDGWEKGSAKLMAEVFTEDASFVPDPWGSPIKGRAAVQEYWDNLPFEQSEVAFRFGEIYAAGPWFATEFRCSFRRRRTGERVDVRGSLFCETLEGRISEMRMYWDRRTGR